jgi:protein TonB
VAQKNGAERPTHLSPVDKPEIAPAQSRVASNRARWDSEECPTIEIVPELVHAEEVIVVAVTADREMRAALQEALPPDYVLFADSAEQVLARPVPDNCGILIVEQTLGRAAFEQVKAHLKSSAPALVNMMVGTQHDGSAMVGLLSTGVIDRFMVKPLKLGPTRNALRSALQQHQSLRPRERIDSTSPDTATVERASANDQPIRISSPVVAPVLRPVVDPIVEAKAVEIVQPPSTCTISVNAAPSNGTETNESVSTDKPLQEFIAQTATPRAYPPHSAWNLAAAAVIALAGFGAWFMSARAPEIDANTVIAAHLTTAQKAFELGHYADPPELSAVHFYNAALELDPGNAQAKSGLEAVADRLIADGRRLIADGDLLRAQSALDNVRRLQPNHRELAEATNSLLLARDAERMTIQAARSAKPNPEPVADVAHQSVAAKPVVVEPQVERQIENSYPPMQRAKQVPIAVAKVDAPLVSKPAATLATIEPTSPPAVAAQPTQYEEPVSGATATVAAATTPADTPRVTSSEVAAVNEAPSSLAPSVATAKTKLIKYVAPVYPYKARVGTEGWVDVDFVVTRDGNVINPRIANGTLGPSFHRAALTAVSQWKFSSAPDGAKPNRPMNVRLEFKLTN